jgi:site-specific recombinase XerD
MKLMERIHLAMRRAHYSPRTEKAYVHWILEYLRFHGMKHPDALGEEHLRDFLSHLATERKLSASSQGQALNALVYLYRVLGIELGTIGEFERPRRKKNLPVVLAQKEVPALLDCLSPPYSLMARVLYGGGLRLSEVISLRIKDLDFDRMQISVRDGKGGKDRLTILPKRIISTLHEQVKRISGRHRADVAAGRGYVDLPFALRKKYPNANRDLGWQYLFPASRLCRDQ